MAGWAVLTALVVGLAAGASPALALETSQCLPATQVRAALAAEGQAPVVIGNRSGYGSPMALIFFANADGSKGYAVRSDKPLGQQGETACIDSVYRDVRLNDITQPGIPAWAKRNDDAATARAVCKRERLGYQDQCQPSGEVLASLDRFGTRVMFMATGTAINPRDKSVRSNQRVFVFVDGRENKGGVEAVTPDGASYLLSAYTNASYTQAADRFIAAARR